MKKSILALLFLCLSSSGFAQIQPTSGAERLKGLSVRQQMEKSSLLKNVKFRNIGPTIMSGRAVDLEVNPEDPTEFYVAYASGGLWHTVNNGQSFSPIFDHEDALTIGDIAVDWKSRAIWVGTGEVNSSRSSYAGVGIYFSADTGKTWQYKGLPESHHIGKILIDSRDPQTVFVAVLGHLYTPNKERGIYKTTDGGNNWKQVLSVDDTTGASEVQQDPIDPKVMYASMWHRDRHAWNFTESGKTSGIYKSINNGDTWNLLTKDGSGFPAGDGVGRIGVAIYPKNNNILYAFVDNQDKAKDYDKPDTSIIKAKDLKDLTKDQFLKLNDKKLDDFLKQNDFPDKYSADKVKELIKKDSIKPADVLAYLNDANNSLFESPIKGAEIYRSEDAGKTWKKTHEVSLKNLCYTYGYYFGKVFVSPFDDKKIVVCGLPLVMSTDGGKTFKTIDGDNTHGDHHAVWMDPKKDKHMIICNDGGVNITYDEGAIWFKANNPPVGQFYSVAVDDDKPYNVYGGLQDNGVWTGSSNTVNSTDWLQEGAYPYKSIMGGDGMQVQVDTRDNATVYTGYQFGYYYRVSKTNGATVPVKPQNDIGEANFRFNWQSPIWLSRHNQDILYFGSNRFHRSMRKGEDWETLSSDLTQKDKAGDVPFNTITTIHESPRHFGWVYCGTDDGFVWKSKDAGSTWTKISTKLPQGLYVSRVTASSFKDGRIYVSLNGYRNDHFNPYVFVSEDDGENWTDISSGLPYEPVNVIREDVKNENLIFAGTDNGLYASLNNGKNWMLMNGDLPRVAVHDLVVHPRESEIVIGTHGRSLYIASLKEIRMLDDSTISKSLVVFDFDDIDFNKRWGNSSDPFHPSAKPTISVPYFVNVDGILNVTIKNEKGVMFKSVTDSSEAGINYLNIDLSIDSVNATKVVKTKMSFVKADDGNYYFPVGKYTMEFKDAKGKMFTKEFHVKDSAIKNSPQPATEKE